MLAELPSGSLSRYSAKGVVSKTKLTGLQFSCPGMNFVLLVRRISMRQLLLDAQDDATVELLAALGKKLDALAVAVASHRSQGNKVWRLVSASPIKPKGDG